MSGGNIDNERIFGAEALKRYQQDLTNKDKTQRGLIRIVTKEEGTGKDKQIVRDIEYISADKATEWDKFCNTLRFFTGYGLKNASVFLEKNITNYKPEDVTKIQKTTRDLLGGVGKTSKKKLQKLIQEIQKHTPSLGTSNATKSIDVENWFGGKKLDKASSNPFDEDPATNVALEALKIDNINKTDIPDTTPPPIVNRENKTSIDSKELKFYIEKFEDNAKTYIPTTITEVICDKDITSDDFTLILQLLPNLTTLNISNTSLKDEDLIKNKEHLEKITILDCTGSKNIKGSFLKESCLNVQKLVLKNCLKLTDANLKAAALENLKELDCSNNPELTGSGFDNKSFNSLTELSIEGCTNMIDFTFKKNELTNLEKFNGGRTSLNGSFLKDAPFVNTLTKLSLKGCKDPLLNINLNNITFPLLEECDYSDTNINKNNISIDKYPKLKNFSFEVSKPLNIASFDSKERVNSKTVLELINANQTDRLHEIKKLKCSPDISSADFKKILDFISDLETLRIPNCKLLTDEDLMHRSLSKLKGLDCKNTLLTGKFLDNMQNSIQSLFLDGCQKLDKSKLRVCLKIKKPTQLKCTNTNLDEKVIRDALTPHPKPDNYYLSDQLRDKR